MKGTKTFLRVVSSLYWNVFVKNSCWAVKMYHCSHQKKKMMPLLLVGDLHLRTSTRGRPPEDLTWGPPPEDVHQRTSLEDLHQRTSTRGPHLRTSTSPEDLTWGPPPHLRTSTWGPHTGRGAGAELPLSCPLIEGVEGGGGRLPLIGSDPVNLNQSNQRRQRVPGNQRQSKGRSKHNAGQD